MAEERRTDPRFKVSVPVEMLVDGQETSMRCATSDISMGGCYIENRYTLPIGACLEMKMDIGDTLLVFGQVVTADPQVGNGIRFTKVLPEDRDELLRYLNALEAPQPSGPASN